MKLFPSLFRARVRILVLAAAVVPATAFAQLVPLQIPSVFVTATRTPADIQALGSAFDVIGGAELAQRQVYTLSDALGGVAGAPLFASGAGGATTSLFLRGANSSQTLFLVDGVRVNDPSTDYQVLLGGLCLSLCDNLEIAHGPQSTLYGGEAIGGVVALRAQPGQGEPSGIASFEAGSFGTLQGALGAQGTKGAWGYNLSSQGGHTENGRANNAFDSTTTTLRVDRVLGPRLATGGTLRWFRGKYGDPGDRWTNDPDNSTREDNVLVTAFADAAVSDALTGRILVGGQDRRFVAESPRSGGATQVTVVKNRRVVLDAQASYTGWARQRWTGGFTAEANHTRNTGFGDINRKQGLLAVFVQDEFSPLDNLHFSAGLRSDDFDTFGRATTGRATAAWMVLPQTLKLRSSYGTAFRSPSFLDLYGQSSFYVGNPNLNPERARSWDAGLDFYLPGARGTASLTWFETRFSDLVVFDFSGFPGTVVNVERARTRGLEASGNLRLASRVEARLAYAYLEADNLSQQVRLLRRPRHTASVDVWADLGRGVTAGAGVKVVLAREDVDAATFATVDGEDFTVARVHLAWQASPRLGFKLRAENLLDENYEEVNGYPALGFGVFAGAEWKW